MFTKFYDQKHQGRKLVWDHALGTVILKTRFDAGSKDLSLSLYQTIVMSLFADIDEVTFTDIKAQTRMGMYLCLDFGHSLNRMTQMTRSYGSHFRAWRAVRRKCY